MPEVLDEFPRPAAGRPVRYDVSDIKSMADMHPGQVVAEVLDEHDAQSVRRQFQKMAGYKVMTTKHKDKGMRRVLVQRKVK
jgi:hypothetical protein